MTRYKKLLDRVRAAGEADFQAGKPIDSFYSLKLRDHTEMLRAEYEMGWRGAKEEQRKSNS